MVTNDVLATATACLFLAGKVEEHPKRLRSVLTTIHHAAAKNSKAAVLHGKKQKLLDLESDRFFETKNRTIKAERRVLKELGFCVHVKHPHKLIICFADVMGISDNTKLVQLAWNYMNDGLRTLVFVRFSPEVIACACLHLGCIKLQIPMPEWWVNFDVTTEQVEEVGGEILSLYSQPRRFEEDMFAELNALKAEKAKRTIEDASVSPKTSSSSTVQLHRSAPPSSTPGVSPTGDLVAVPRKHSPLSAQNDRGDTRSSRASSGLINVAGRAMEKGQSVSEKRAGLVTVTRSDRRRSRSRSRDRNRDYRGSRDRERDRDRRSSKDDRDQSRHRSRSPRRDRNRWERDRRRESGRDRW